jgi:hypothetical protein
MWKSVEEYVIIIVFRSRFPFQIRLFQWSIRWLEEFGAAQFIAERVLQEAAKSKSAQLPKIYLFIT